MTDLNMTDLNNFKSMSHLEKFTKLTMGFEFDKKTTTLLKTAFDDNNLLPIITSIEKTFSDRILNPNYKHCNDKVTIITNLDYIDKQLKPNFLGSDKNRINALREYYNCLAFQCLNKIMIKCIGLKLEIDGQINSINTSRDDIIKNCKEIINKKFPLNKNITNENNGDHMDIAHITHDNFICEKYLHFALMYPNNINVKGGKKQTRRTKKNASRKLVSRKVANKKRASNKKRGTQKRK